MAEILYYAIPFFVLLLVVEAISFRHARDEADDLIGYEAKDTRTSLLLGSGNVVINVAWKLVVVAIFAGIYELTPLRLDPGDWWVWVLLFFALHRRPAAHGPGAIQPERGRRHGGEPVAVLAQARFDVRGPPAGEQHVRRSGHDLGAARRPDQLPA